MARNGFKWLNNIWVSKSALLTVNALLLPFGAPLIAWLVICQCYSALLSGLSGAVGGAAALTLIGLLPCSLLYAVGLSGALQSVKSVLVDGNMDIRRNFSSGIRKNAPKYIPIAFVMWASSSFAVMTPSLYLAIGNGILYGVGLAVSVFQWLVVMPAMCLATVQCAFYDDKLRYCFSNAFKLYFMRPLRTLGVTALCALPFALCAIFPFVWQLVFWVLYSVAGVSIGTIFYVWYGKRYFDEIVGRVGKTDDVVALGKDDEAPYEKLEPKLAERVKE